MNRFKRLWLRAGGFILAALFYILLAVSGIGCPIRAVTGIPCAGCGMTRAYLSLLHFDLKQAFYYHPLFWLVPFIIALVFIKRGPLAKPKVRIFFWTLFAAAFIVVYIFRLLIIKDSAIYISL